MWYYVDAFLGLVVIHLLYRLSKRSKRSTLPLPPGPKGSPLIGNLLQVPQTYAWLQYHKWCKELDTDLLYLNIAGMDIIVLDTAKGAIDLFETRSSIYSSRPHLPMIMDVLKCDWHIALLPYGARWRKYRRLMHHSFHPLAVKQYNPHITKATRNLLRRLLDDPDPLNILSHLRHLSGDTALSIAYGIEVQQENDPYLERSIAAVDALGAAGKQGAFLVDIFPFLKHVPAWLPGASFQRKARVWRQLVEDTLELPYAQVKKEVESGKRSLSMVSMGLQKMEEGTTDEAFTEDAIRNTAGSIFTAGSDTTVSAIATSILGLLEHPEVLKKAQAQIDAVVKPGHLPDLEDEPSLPYITAIAKETLRWRDVTPIGVPHSLTTEDEYKGYRIPAGAIIIPNAWAMLHDETVYPNPFTFNPDRFINPETGKIDYTRARDPSHACWGFGRRACPGRYMAFSAIWLAIASLVAVFDIEKAKEKVVVVGEDGVEREEERTVELTHEYISAIHITPKPFKCVIKPRSLEKEDLIRESGARYPE